MRLQLLRTASAEKAAHSRFKAAVSIASSTLRPNLHALGIGRKIVKGKATSARCVRLYVAKKYAESSLPIDNRLPKEVEGVPTDVIESPPAALLGARPGKRQSAGESAPPSAMCSAARRAKVRPLVAGISTAHFDLTAGTLGAFCRSLKPGDDPGWVFVLSNNHVYADLNRAQVGDELRQPGPADGGTNSGCRIAVLHRWTPIRIGGALANTVDAAIGKLDDGIEYRAEVCSIGAILGLARAVENMAVCKHGRTTGYTEGLVTDESYDVLIGVDENDSSRVALFENQMRLEKAGAFAFFALRGDSGSLVVKKGTGKAVGLYFAGPPGGEYGVANHIQDVLGELHIVFL